MSNSVASAREQESQPQGKYKRKLTDARREQNRRSQRLWRDKQKQRHDEQINARVQQELAKRGGDSADTLARPEFQSSQLDEISVEPHLGSKGNEEVNIPEPVLPLKVAVYYYVPPVPGAEDCRHSWPVPDDVEFKTYTLPPRITPRSSAPSSLSSSVSPFERLSPMPLYEEHSSSSHLSMSGSPSQKALPSPFLNHLQLVGESCFAATMSIAQSLGISMQAYINDHPSPFSTASNANVHKVPVDLRPTAHQLIISHPSYLDCIPFPHFRSMAIYLSSIKRLDHCSLFLDLMHDGMVCWGRERASAQCGRSMRDGVSWNKRSWEVRPWFWRKWSWIARMTVEGIDAGLDSAVVVQESEEEFDDEDGMLSGSQWWWSLHSDSDENSPANQTSSSSIAPQPEKEHEELGSFLSRVHTCNVGVRKPEEAHMLVHWE